MTRNLFYYGPHMMPTTGLFQTKISEERLLSSVPSANKPKDNHTDATKLRDSKSTK